MNDEHVKMLEQTKYLITQLTNIQELYFDSLLDELNITLGGEDWVFDFIYNDKSDDSLESYLTKYGKTLQFITDE